MAEWRTRDRHKAEWLEEKAENEAFMAKHGSGVSIDSGYKENPWEKE
jgi:hypothetical protein